MKIEYLGHACFKLDDKLVIDPYKDGSVPGLPPLRTRAEQVICSHQHPDHSGVECVEILSESNTDNNRDAAENTPFQIEEIPSWHDDQEGALRGPNTIFVITDSGSGEKLVHLGDLGHLLDDAKLAKIKNADYLLIPVGGHFTIDAKTAVDLCLAAEPKTIIPMHYRTENSGYPELVTVDEFLNLAKGAGISDKVKVMQTN